MRPTGLTVATYNLYLGADLAPLFSASGDDLAARAAMVWSTVEASRPVERMEAAARLLLRHLPDVVGVQEAALWRAGTIESARVHDLLTLLLESLEAHGVTYRVAAEAHGFSSVALSSALASTTGQLVELHDRSAILVRDDPAIRYGEPAASPFQQSLTVHVTGHPVEVLRGWCAVDVRVGAAELRVVNAHLESYSAGVRQAQASELAQVLAQVPEGRRTVVLCDLNCRPVGCRSARRDVAPGAREVDGDAFEILLGTGLVDAWAAVHPDQPCGGFTSGQEADLRNPASTLDQRIDVVLVDPRCCVGQALVIGDSPDERTPSGLWPSDHACVVVELEV